MPAHNPSLHYQPRGNPYIAPIWRMVTITHTIMLSKCDCALYIRVSSRPTGILSAQLKVGRGTVLTSERAAVRKKKWS